MVYTSLSYIPSVLQDSVRIKQWIIKCHFGVVISNVDDRENRWIEISKMFQISDRSEVKVVQRKSLERNFFIKSTKIDMPEIVTNL